MYIVEDSASVSQLEVAQWPESLEQPFAIHARVINWQCLPISTATEVGSSSAQLEIVSLNGVVSLMELPAIG